METTDNINGEHIYQLRASENVYLMRGDLVYCENDRWYDNTDKFCPEPARLRACDASWIISKSFHPYSSFTIQPA